ncbi:alphaN-acetylglucosamine transferase, partial [Trichophaea hybrida]
HAYVFYATSNPYACSALVNAHRLRNFLKSKIPIIFLLGPGVNVPAIDAITASNIGITVVRDNAPALPTGSMEYYEEVLLKLRAFRLHHVYPALERVIVMDSDQLVRKNLDHLFRLPAVDVAAPLLYWGEGMGVTTALMVVRLREELWGIVNNAMKHMTNGEYDMDLINKVLGKRLMVLPGRYCTLNSHWEAGDTPGWFKGIKTSANATSEELVELYDQVEVLHFTAMGKPWNVAPGRIDGDREILRKNKVHPLFVKQFGEWHGNATEVCTA